MTYKSIIHNIIATEVDNFIRKRSNRFPCFDDKNISTVTEKDCIYFTIEDVQVSQGVYYNEYKIGGYVNENGDVYVCSVTFNRTYCDKNFENEHTEYFFVYGEELKTFKFDR